MDSKSTPRDDARERVLFVTGRLAEGIVRQVVTELPHGDGRYEVHVVGISVAALMHVDWLKRKLTIDQVYDRVILPGWCQGDLAILEAQFGMRFERGPKDIQDITDTLGSQDQKQPDLSRYDIEIIAEINHAPQLDVREIMRLAEEYRLAGADVIDVGCVPGGSWPQVGEVVRLLKQSGFRISIDSFDRSEVETAVESGAELVFSCNSTNVDWVSVLGVELVVIPDDPRQIDSMWDTAARLDVAGCRYRLDPILEPIGFGFAASLARYYDVRRRAPQAAILMGVGNLTELTEVDSAGVNVLLAAICQELGIHSVLTTQVINWCRTAVAELDRARRLVKYAIDHQTLPKRVSSELLLLRDPRTNELGEEMLQRLARELKDPNYRIFVERGEIHILSRSGYWRGTDPFELFDRFTHGDEPLDPAHAFYLGYELAKAVTALTLGKQYRQDQALQWGFLTIPETSAHARRRPDAGRETK